MDKKEKSRAVKGSNFLSEYTGSRFVRGFVLKSVLLLAVLFGLNLFIFLFLSTLPAFRQNLTIPDVFYFSALTGLSKGKMLNAFIFTAVIFIIYIRKKIPTLREYPFRPVQAAICLAFSIILFFTHYFLKYWIHYNLEFALAFAPVLRILKYALLAGFVVLLTLAVYGMDFLGYFVKSFYKEIIIFVSVFFAYWGLVELFQMSWPYLSAIVTRAVGFLLSLSFKDVIIQPVTPKGPQVGVGAFAPYVSAECSGIDSLQLFISIFVFLLVLDWKAMDRKKMLILFIPGVIATFVFNILRVYMIMLVGIFISPEFAINIFHTNIGWILFLGFFYVFWTFGSKYVYLKRNKEENKNKD
jgi:exosortase/archaeosortase family protein